MCLVGHLTLLYFNMHGDPDTLQTIPRTFLPWKNPHWENSPETNHPDIRPRELFGQVPQIAAEQQSPWAIYSVVFYLHVITEVIIVLSKPCVLVTGMFPYVRVIGVKVSRNAILVPGNLSLEHSGCKIIGFHSRNLHSWDQQFSSLHYSNLIVIQISHFLRS